jgi:hypothetical protein
MPPKQKKGERRAQQQSQMAKQEQLMQQMNSLYELSNIEQMNQPPAPLDVLMSATPTLLLGVFTISTFCRWYFKESKPISKQKLLQILTSTYQAWGYTLTDSSKHEQKIMQSNPDMGPEEKKQVTEYLRYQLIQQLNQAEESLLQQANTNKDQIQEAIKVYEGDKQVAKLTADLNKIVGTIIPPPPLPYPWTETDVISILSELFELRISSMEEASQSLQLDQRPKGVPLTPQMAEDLNQLFNETLQRRLDRFYKDKKVTPAFLQKLMRSISNSANYVDLVHTYKQEQQQRYAALGLEVKKR